jgi:hypothetical protein
MASKKNRPKKKFPVELPDTFFNANLLKVNPFELRDDLFAGRRREDGWQLVENLLWIIEHSAKKLVEEYPDFNLNFSGSEDQFHDSLLSAGSKLNQLTDEQRNAIAALRSIKMIRQKLNLVEAGGRYVPLELVDTDFVYSCDSATMATTMLETVLLTMAVVRGDYWSLIEQAYRANYQRRETSSKGVAVRKQRHNDMLERCRTLGTNLRPRRRALSIRRALRLQNPKQKIPVLRTILRWIKEKKV